MCVTIFPQEDGGRRLMMKHGLGGAGRDLASRLTSHLCWLQEQRSWYYSSASAHFWFRFCQLLAVWWYIDHLETEIRRRYRIGGSFPSEMKRAKVNEIQNLQKRRIAAALDVYDVVYLQIPEGGGNFINKAWYTKIWRKLAYLNTVEHRWTQMIMKSANMVYYAAGGSQTSNFGLFASEPLVCTRTLWLGVLGRWQKTSESRVQSTKLCKYPNHIWYI